MDNPSQSTTVNSTADVVVDPVDTKPPFPSEHQYIAAVAFVLLAVGLCLTVKILKKYIHVRVEDLCGRHNNNIVLETAPAANESPQEPSDNNNISGINNNNITVIRGLVPYPPNVEIDIEDDEMTVEEYQNAVLRSFYGYAHSLSTIPEEDDSISETLNEGAVAATEKPRKLHLWDKVEEPEKPQTAEKDVPPENARPATPNFMRRFNNFRYAWKRHVTNNADLSEHVVPAEVRHQLQSMYVY